MRLTSGMSATEGIGRRNSITARTAVFRTGTLPSRMPSGTPPATAMARPMAQALMVLQRLVRKSASPARLTARPRIVEAGGR